MCDQERAMESPAHSLERWAGLSVLVAAPADGNHIRGAWCPGNATSPSGKLRAEAPLRWRAPALLNIKPVKRHGAGCKESALKSSQCARIVVSSFQTRLLTTAVYTTHHYSHDATSHFIHSGGID